MSDLFEYAVLLAVPRVQRGESVNVGVVVYCQQAEYLEARVHVEDARLLTLDPDIDLAAIREALDAICRTCRGEGPAGATPLRARFGWLTAPRSTVVRAGPVHMGRSDDPAAELKRLTEALVH